MSMQQNDDGSWTEATPLGFLGQGVDWEVYGNEKPLRAVGYIGHRLVAEVTAREPRMLRLKMFAAGLPYRKTSQSDGDETETSA